MHYQAHVPWLLSSTDWPSCCRVDLVTHSMGGLVVKSFLAQYPEEFERYVRTWIAVAVPFGGAPGENVLAS